MGKVKQEVRARKCRRKVSCMQCDKTISWEYFRNHHVPTVHNGKKVAVRVIAGAKAPGSSSQSVDIRNLFASSVTTVSIQYIIYIQNIYIFVYKIYFLLVELVEAKQFYKGCVHFI